ncbi:MAG: FkbM family methyltransferase [Deltaproteobacteria bacterium]|nr:FkbM family methyltransferase [Deltaproteobacteria bacterium]
MEGAVHGAMRYYHLLKNLSNWWLYLFVKFGGLKRRDPLLFRTRRGVSVEVPRRLLQTFKEIFMDECYMRGLEAPVPENPNIVDIGANAGYFSLFAASRFPGAWIFAFEPVPANFALLDRNRKLNPHVRLSCLSAAVAGRSGEITLTLDPEDTFPTSATIIGEPEAQRKNTVRVEAVTLPDIFAKYRIDRLDLLKMDCEGAEYEILYHTPGDVLAKICQMALEVHKGPEPGQNIEALSDYLGKQGFGTRQRPVGMLWAWRR